MQKFVAIAMVSLLTSCAIPPKVISTSPRSVAVQAFKGLQVAQDIAEAECQKHARHARWAAGSGPDFIFDCVN